MFLKLGQKSLLGWKLMLKQTLYTIYWTLLKCDKTYHCHSHKFISFWQFLDNFLIDCEQSLFCSKIPAGGAARNRVRYSSREPRVAWGRVSEEWKERLPSINQLRAVCSMHFCILHFCILHFWSPALWWRSVLIGQSMTRWHVSVIITWRHAVRANGCRQ